MRIRLAGAADVLEGEPEEIVRAMQSRAFGVDHLDLSDYIAWVTEQAFTRMGIELTVEGATVAERAASLLRALVARGLAEQA